MIRSMTYAVLTLTIFIFISSCQKMLGTYIPVYYNISNETDNKLTVLYNLSYNNNGQEYDTIINIAQGQKKTLFVLLNDYQNIGKPETEDTLTWIYAIRVYSNDSIESKKNYRLTKYWRYKEYSTKGDFDLNINPEDF